jgi:hypothetical protein
MSALVIPGAHEYQPSSLAPLPLGAGHLLREPQGARRRALRPAPTRSTTEGEQAIRRPRRARGPMLKAVRCPRGRYPLFLRSCG